MAARKKRSRRRAAKPGAKARTRKRGVAGKRLAEREKPLRAAKARAGAKRGAPSGRRTAKRPARQEAARTPSRARAQEETALRPGSGAAPSPSSAPEPPAPRAAPPALAVLASEPVRAGVVRHYFSRAGAALVSLEAPLAAGEHVHVRGATSDFIARVESLRVAGAPVARAEAGEATLALPERARRGDVVYALRAPA